ncbi:hypothetical protein BDV11DRAFT_10160 [Aspergillus similis]
MPCSALVVRFVRGELNICQLDKNLQPFVTKLTAKVDWLLHVRLERLKRTWLRVLRLTPITSFLVTLIIILTTVIFILWLFVGWVINTVVRSAAWQIPTPGERDVPKRNISYNNLLDHAVKILVPGRVKIDLTISV